MAFNPEFSQKSGCDSTRNPTKVVGGLKRGAAGKLPISNGLKVLSNPFEPSTAKLHWKNASTSVPFQVMTPKKSFKPVERNGESRIVFTGASMLPSARTRPTSVLKLSLRTLPRESYRPQRDSCDRDDVKHAVWELSRQKQNSSQLPQPRNLAPTPQCLVQQPGELPMTGLRSGLISSMTRQLIPDRHPLPNLRLCRLQRIKSMCLNS